MGHERWFRGQHDGQGRPFDWRAQARQHGVPEQRARALYEQAMQQARGASGGHVEELYLALLADARPETWRPAPGKVTRTMRLEAGQAGRQRRRPQAARAGRRSAAPGKVTLTSYLAPRDPGLRDRSSDSRDEHMAMDAMAELLRRYGLPAPVAQESPRDQTLHAALARRLDTAGHDLDDLPWTVEAMSDEVSGEATGDETFDEAASDDAWTGEAMSDAALGDVMSPEVEHLPEATRARMERAFGHAFGDVVIHPDSPEATGATRALTRGREIHFRAGTYEPGTADGDRLIAHELAHVVQQTARPGQSAGRRALEREADRAAGAILAGQRAAVSLGASMGAALAFSDSEDHEVDEQEERTPASADAAGAAAGESAAGEPARSADAAAETSADADAEGAESPEGAEGDEEALLAEIRTPVPVEGGPAGGAGGGGAGAGGGEAVAVEAEAPEVSGSPPEQGLAALQGARPDKLAGALDGVRTAASGEVSEERAELAQDPPQQMSTGDAAAEAAPGAGGPDGARVAAGEDAAAGQPARAAAGEGEGAEAAAEPGRVDNADTAAAGDASPPPVASASAPAVDNAPADENNASGGLSEADGERMSEAIAAVPTQDPHANTDPGPAPELAMTEDARAGAARDRDSLDTSVNDAGTTAATHIAQPMGEDHIEVTLAPEALKAQLAGEARPGAGAAGAAVDGAGKALGAAKAEALGDAGESAAIIAQLERGAEIDAALATAQGQVAAERQAHAERGVDERARADQEIAALKTQSEAEQEQARTDARAQVDQARTDWQAEVDTQTEAARTEADAEVEAGLADVEAEQSNANSEAERHIDKGKADAESEQKRGEEEAERVKKEKESESSGGFFGWLASKAKAFFEGLKKAISDVLDAARKAIKRVIEAAKQLAVQVIEAARKAIVATIKAVGKALIAIGDRLLAAFPALRERFRNAIQGFVDQAVEAVNALAESLKENVQKALDLLGKGLDAALGLLERGLHAIVDGVNAVVQGAISFAKGVVEALGAFAVLIKDIAGDTGGWLGKLGGAVMDGIRNHLWGALQAAVLAWFGSKALELLGIGGMVVQMLMEGGIDMGQITSMAWEALQSAIPIALIAILVEKLVSMIVPAAGAVLAIIEGLQAAWGTVSRIIAAFGAFVAFLKAIKGGAAGPLFANLLAAAAVVVLDFVSNWLLRKLASAARKVGAKLKKLAEKFKNRRKGKGKGKQKPRPDKDRPDKDRPDKDKPKDDKDQKKKDEIKAKVERAQRELPPKIRSLLAKKPSRMRVKGMLLVWRAQYGLKSLQIEGKGAVTFKGKINPTLDLGNGWEITWDDVLRAINDVAQEYLDKLDGSAGTGAGTDEDPLKITPRENPARVTQAVQENQGVIDVGSGVRASHVPHLDPKKQEKGVTSIVEVGKQNEKPPSYQTMAKDLDGVDVGAAFRKLLQGEDVDLPQDKKDKLGALFVTMFGMEGTHPNKTMGHKRDLVYALMATELLDKEESVTLTSLFNKNAAGKNFVDKESKKLPAAGIEGPPKFGTIQFGTQQVTQKVVHGEGYGTDAEPKMALAEKIRARREINLFTQWMKATGHLEKMEEKMPDKEDLKNEIRRRLREYLSGKRG